MAVLNSEFKSDERIEDGAAELGEHGESFAPAWAARGLVAGGLEQGVVDAEHVEGILAKIGKVRCGLTAEAVEN